MTQRTTLFLAILALVVSVLVSCGSKCPKVNAGKSAEALAYDDATRVNRLVERRKLAMKTAEKGSQYDVEKAMFTVTACELGTKLQLRIINLAEEGDSAYEENRKRIDETRCMLDKILNKKGKVMGFVGKGGFISKTDASSIQDEYQYYKMLLGITGEPSESQVVNAFENGMPADKPKGGKGEKAGKGGPSEENEPTVEATGEGAAEGAEGAAEGEGEEGAAAEGEEGEGADESPIDSF